MRESSFVSLGILAFALVAVFLGLLAKRRRERSVSLEPQAAVPAAAQAQPIPKNGQPSMVMKTEVVSQSGPELRTQIDDCCGVLLCTSGPLSGRKFPVDEAGVRIGRYAGHANVVIRDTHISSLHVTVFARNGKAWAVDEQSVNGTFVPRVGKITSIQLNDGDTIILAKGVATFEFQGLH
jgi:hypothetical protein